MYVIQRARVKVTAGYGGVESPVPCRVPKRQTILPLLHSAHATAFLCHNDATQLPLFAAMPAALSLGYTLVGKHCVYSFPDRPGLESGYRY